MIASTSTIKALQDELAALRQRVAELECECDQAKPPITANHQEATGNYQQHQGSPAPIR